MRPLELIGAFFLLMGDAYAYIGDHALWFSIGAFFAVALGFVFYWLPKAGHL